MRAAAARGEAVFGTVDTWVIWNLTGGPDGGAHVTDVTNASRTMLMDLRTLEWDDELLKLFDIPREMLPSIRAVVGSRVLRQSRAGPDRSGAKCPSAATSAISRRRRVGQVCIAPGEAKNTYGTGNFMLLNTGTEDRSVESRPAHDGLLQARRRGRHLRARRIDCRHRIRGPVAARSARHHQAPRPRSKRSRSTVEDTAASYFVPAFSGLFAPYWRSDARGAIVGLSRFHTRAHLARATLEAICFQTRAVLDAMVSDSGVRLELLKVDGGATVNDTLMQLQADVLGVPVVRPVVAETTALGAAYAAGLATGFWKDLDQLRQNWKADRQWEPRSTLDQRESSYRGWQKAVERTLNWVDVG